MKLSLESKRAKDPKQKTGKYYRIFVCNYFKLNCIAGCNYGVYLFTKGSRETNICGHCRTRVLSIPKTS